MDIDVILNRIGFFITLAAAVYTCYEACRVKKIRAEILNDRQKFLLVNLVTEAKNVRTAAQKLSPLSRGKLTRGFASAEEMKKIQFFIENLNDNLHLLNEEIPPKLQNLKENFNRYKTAEASDVTELNEIGDLIYCIINDIISELNRCFFEKM